MIFWFYFLEDFILSVFIFILLLTKISVHRCQRRGQIGGLPIFIACLSLLNGLFSISRFAFLFPGLNDKVNMNFFKVAYFSENICFFGATLLFSTVFFEAVADIDNLLSANELKQTD